jgi:hypothetical protein
MTRFGGRATPPPLPTAWTGAGARACRPRSPLWVTPPPRHPHCHRRHHHHHHHHHHWCDRCRCRRCRCRRRRYCCPAQPAPPAASEAPRVRGRAATARPYEHRHRQHPHQQCRHRCWRRWLRVRAPKPAPRHPPAQETHPLHPSRLLHGPGTPAPTSCQHWPAPQGVPSARARPAKMQTTNTGPNKHTRQQQQQQRWKQASRHHRGRPEKSKR